ncbi:hypothetical protein [Halospeciosus flavus]|uniref:Uncharacterized protein n=1 Tax=Halospeciosus flavus TaxID=3032283 RepID=A0ABD5Z855_9EURY|nr:hypothetical protein [Halospeciosus flavus]
MGTVAGGDVSVVPTDALDGLARGLSSLVTAVLVGLGVNRPDADVPSPRR